MKQFIPFGQRVAVTRCSESSSPSDNPLTVPEVGKEKPQEGTVLAVGTSVISDIIIGDHIMFTKFAGNEINVNGATITVMHETEILGKIKEIHVG